MMLNLDRIQTIAQSYNPQELFAALVYQRRFEDWEFREYVSLRLQGGLWGENFKRDRDAAIISYWWD